MASGPSPLDPSIEPIGLSNIVDHLKNPEDSYIRLSTTTRSVESASLNKSTPALTTIDLRGNKSIKCLSSEAKVIRSLYEKAMDPENTSLNSSDLKARAYLPQLSIGESALQAISDLFPRKAYSPPTEELPSNYGSQETPATTPPFNLNESLDDLKTKFKDLTSSSKNLASAEYALDTAKSALKTSIRKVNDLPDQVFFKNTVDDEFKTLETSIKRQLRTIEKLTIILATTQDEFNTQSEFFVDDIDAISRKVVQMEKALQNTDEGIEDLQNINEAKEQLQAIRQRVDFLIEKSKEPTTKIPQLEPTTDLTELTTTLAEKWDESLSKVSAFSTTLGSIHYKERDNLLFSYDERTYCFTATSLGSSGPINNLRLNKDKVFVPIRENSTSGIYCKKGHEGKIGDLLRDLSSLKESDFGPVAMAKKLLYEKILSFTRRPF